MATVTTTLNGVLVRTVSTTLNGYLVHASGSYRGAMTDTVWDSLTKTAGDSAIITDAATGKPKGRVTLDGSTDTDFGAGVHVGESNQPNDLFGTSLVIQQKDTSTVAVSIDSAGSSYTAHLTRWRDSGGTTRLIVDGTGRLNSYNPVYISSSFVSSHGAISLWPGDASIRWGDGTNAPDIIVSRSAANVLALGSGDSFNFGTGSQLNASDYIKLPEVAATIIPDRVQTNSNSASATSLSVTWGTATTAGNMTIAAFAWDGTATVSSAPTGMTLLTAVVQAAGSGATTNLAIYYELNCSAGEANPSITLSASSAIVGITAEYSGLLTAAAADQEASSTDTTADGSHSTGTTGTTTQATELWLGALASTDVGTLGFSGSPTNGFTYFNAKIRGTGIGLGLYDKVVTATGTASLTDSYIRAGVSGASEVGKIATFKAASSGTAPGTPAANTLVIYAKDSGGVTRLFYKDDGGTERGPL